MSDLQDWLSAAEARCERASEGLWYPVGNENAHWASDWHGKYGRDRVCSFSPEKDVPGWTTDSGSPGYGLLKADAEFCAAARSDLPRALGLLRKALAVVEAVRAYTTLRNYLTIEACRMDQDRLEKLMVEKLIRFDAAAKDEGGG